MGEGRPLAWGRGQGHISELGSAIAFLRRGVWRTSDLKFSKLTNYKCDNVRFETLPGVHNQKQKNATATHSVARKTSAEQMINVID